LLKGVAAAVGVIFIWSGFVVFSRAGVNSALTPYDIAALRFMVAGTLVIPFVKSWWPRHLRVHAIVILALCGPGAAYAMLMYNGLVDASAAYAGVFANGTIPIFTIILALLVTGDKPKFGQILAISIIILGGALVGYEGMTSGGDNLVQGIILLVSASAVLSVYIYGVQYWKVTPRQALILVNLPNTLIFLPLWYFFLPSGLAETDTSMILFQAFFQGLGPGFFAVILFTMVAIHLGPVPTAGISASIPASAALLAIPVLSEFPAPIEWTGIGIVTAGLLFLILRRH
jgi:drug/metabolite transporter (DMT)-like permease